MKMIVKIILIVFTLIILGVILLNINKKQHIVYLPFDIPGKQMAATIPPFGSFIEEKYKNNKEILCHEKAHWTQYKRMGLCTFYITYYKEYKKYNGRFNGPMEVEARKLSKIYLMQP